MIWTIANITARHVVSKELDQHITNNYQNWLDHAEYHAALAGIPDQAGDILNTVMESLLTKDPGKINGLLRKKKDGFTELDFFVLRMIKLNAHSPTSPYRHKTRSIASFTKADLFAFNITHDESQEPDANMVILEKSRKAREILEQLNIPQIDKDIFSWKFFADNPLRSWPGDEPYSIICSTYNRVRTQMVRKIKNPHTIRRRWTQREIRYLRSEFPHIETMKLAVYLNRNYDSVQQKAKRLGLRKTTFFIQKRLKKNSPMCRKPA